jgi:hypothetical protein
MLTPLAPSFPQSKSVVTRTTISVGERHDAVTTALAAIETPATPAVNRWARRCTRAS